MKYRIKNEKLAELVYAVFDEETVQQTIAERIDDGSCRISFGSGEIFNAKVNPEHEYLEKTYSSVFLAIDKKEIEKIPEYEKGKWNFYPQVKPPKEGRRYLIQFGNGNDEPFFSIRTWEEENPWHGNFVFRELPELYQPEEQ